MFSLRFKFILTRMNKKLIVAGVLVVGALALLSQIPSKVMAYQGDYTKTGPYHTEAREDAMEKIMAAKDFQAWKKLMTENGRNPGVLRKIDTQAKFDKFAKAYILGKAGKTAEAQAIRAELGLGNGGGQGKGMGRGLGYVDENKNGVCDRAE